MVMRVRGVPNFPDDIGHENLLQAEAAFRYEKRAANDLAMITVAAIIS